MHLLLPPPVVGVGVDLEEGEGDVLDLDGGLLQRGGGLVVAEDVLVRRQVLRPGDQRETVQEVDGGGKFLRREKRGGHSAVQVGRVSNLTSKLQGLAELFD